MKLIEKIPFIPVGMFKDTYYYTDGRVVEGEWTMNQIQNGSAKLAATLYKEVEKNINVSYGGIQYLAVGSGVVSWDLLAPTQDYTTNVLTQEEYRTRIDNTNDIVYLYPDTEVQVAGPTRMLKVSATIPLTVVADLREFALFGGNATSAADTGFMINWKVHNKIEKDSSFYIFREIKLKWLTIPEAEALF